MVRTDDDVSVCASARITKASVERVVVAADMLEVVGQYTQLKKAGASYMGRCPFHEEKTGSFSVNPVDKLYYCFGCGEGGGLLTFVQKKENLDFVQAVEALADRFGVQLDYEDGDTRAGAGRKPSGRRQAQPRPAVPEPSPAELAELASRRAAKRRLWDESLPIDDPAAAAGADYLWRRGIPLLFAVDAKVRFHADFTWKSDAPHRWESNPARGAVVFPVTDVTGRGVDLETRYVDAAEPKSRSTGKGGIFVASPGALEADGVIVVEGPITALSLAACGLPAIALCGHALRPWVAWQLALRTVLVGLDWDEAASEDAGSAAFSALHSVGARPYRLALPAGAGDWNDHLRAVGLATMRSQLDEALRKVTS